MMPFQRILVINPSRPNAKLLRNGFETQGLEVKSIFAGMDSVPAFELFQPDAVVIDDGLRDLPVEAVVEAFRQMNPDIYVFLCGQAETDELRIKCQALAVTGCIIPPFGKVNWEKAMSRVVANEDQDDSLKEEQTHSYYFDDSDWSEFPLLPMHETRQASEFHEGESYRIRGNLKIVGDLVGISRLDITGSLIIDGDVVNCKVRCGRSLRVKGKVDNCRSGIFARGDVEAKDVNQSVVVSGGNLIFRTSCRNSDITALQRIIGISQRSKLIGGRTRVGEQIQIASLGHEDHHHTYLEVAPTWMFDAWRLHKMRLWDMTVRNRPRMSKERINLFSKQATNKKFFQVLGEILADTIYPGVEIVIGEKEDFIFEKVNKPARVSLGRKHKTSFGVCIRKRPTRAFEEEPQKNTANLDS